MFQAKIILDSVSEAGARLTTIQLTYPLIVHNEFLTHRSIGRSDEFEYEEWLEFSRNASSNRARTSEDIITETLADPYIPLEFRKSTRGMVAGEALSEADQEVARMTWLCMLQDQIEGVRDLANLGVAKQWRNRPLGPWQWITVVATANDTHWRHFFNLRNHKAAQPDIATVAKLAQEQWVESSPTLLKTGYWHLPYIDLYWRNTQNQMLNQDLTNMIHQSVARCARVSYARQNELHTQREDSDLFEMLRTSDPPHASPFEHVAKALPDAWKRSGNFHGFAQYRKVLGL